MSRKLSRTARKRLDARWNALVDDVMKMPRPKRAMVQAFTRALVTIDKRQRGAGGLSIVESACASELAVEFPEMIDVIATSKRSAA